MLMRTHTKNRKVTVVLPMLGYDWLPRDGARGGNMGVLADGRRWISCGLVE